MRINTILVGIAMTLLLLASSVAASDYTLDIFGNANEDETINMQDVTYTELIILEYRDRTELADGKYDDKINMQDVTQIELIILGKEKELTLIDQADRIVTVPRPIERIITGLPDPARLVIAFDEGDKLVGLSTYGKFCLCYKGPEVAPICAAEVCGGRLFGLPDVGEYGITNLELTVALKPDVIFSAGFSDVDDVVQEKTGIPTVSIKSGGHEFEEMYETAELMGTILKREDEAQELISLVEEKINKVRDVTSEIPDDEKPTVYFAARGVDPATYGGGITRTINFYEPLNIAGAINVAKDCGAASYGEVDVSKEQIILWNPDIIIVSPHGIGKSFDDVGVILSDPDLQTVAAVKNHKVYFSVYPYCCGTPQDRNLATMMYLAKLFHPEEFADLDVEGEGNEIYEEFLGVDGLFSEYADTTVWLREWLDAQ